MKTEHNKEKPKKSYKSPELIIHGSISEITKEKHKVPKQDGAKRYSQL